MDFKDYYEILGVPPNAEKKVIQQAFRQLARKVHPDVNPDNKEAEEQFKTINQAYQVLSDAKQRKKYDELRVQYQQWQQTGGRRQDFDWQNWSAQPGEEANVRYANPEDLEDLFGGTSPYSDFFTNIFGQQRGRGRGAGQGNVPGPRRGRRCRSTRSISPWKKPFMEQTDHWKWMGTASKPEFQRVCTRDREFAWQGRVSRDRMAARPGICI